MDMANSNDIMIMKEQHTGVCTAKPSNISNFVPRTRPRVETVSERENHGVQGPNITFSTKGTRN